MQNLLPIGKISGAHGIKGNLKVKLYTETTMFFSEGKTVLIKDKNGFNKGYTVSWTEPYKQGVRLGLKEVEDRTAAELLVGSEILIPYSELPEPEEGSYYWFDLIGLEVETEDGQTIGNIDSIIQTGSNDVYVVKNDRMEILIPALESVVLKIDLNNQTMRVKLPEGL
jgi:16S rRNA processing protein RimM